MGRSEKRSPLHRIAVLVGVVVFGVTVVLGYVLSLVLCGLMLFLPAVALCFPVWVVTRDLLLTAVVFVLVAVIGICTIFRKDRCPWSRKRSTE